ncbi:DUF4432 family protein [Bacillus sp. HNG]|uniref:aldose 1-epimerase family protein n=1 Tax=Bacillus sp. HNG TaxID=2293325 RepID=UPI000E2F8E2A|nr:aldose 1-epimerase family protein [Bacillus sp. HNG]RFB17443.1 DUF4432 family protein [Bacillus sp. HNG]
MGKIDFNKREILRHVGDFSQILGFKDYTLNGGKSQGVRAIDVKNGSGLEFTVLADRAMDIAWLSYKGCNLSYISKTGIVSPVYYNEVGTHFFRSFSAGFLTTCGLLNVGSPGIENGEQLGLHGRISNTPSEAVSYDMEWIEGIPTLRVKGKMREAKVFGENVTLNREMITKGGENKIKIRDTVENNGFRNEPIMLLYHFNLGYPLLDENAYLEIPSIKVTPRDAEAEKGIGHYDVLQGPTHGYSEQVFYHDVKAKNNGKTSVALINEKLALAVAIHFNKNELFNLTQWKQMGEGEYVLGIEPCNCFVEGKEDSKNKGVLEYLKPGEIRTFEVEIEIVDGINEIQRIKNDITEI